MREMFALLWSPVIFENIPASSEDFRSFSEAFLALQKTPEDVPKTFERYKTRQLQRVLIFLRHKVIIQSLYGIFSWKLS